MGEDRFGKRRVDWRAGMVACALLGCATSATSPRMSPAGPAPHASAPAKAARLPLVAVGLHDCEATDPGNERTQCQSALNDPISCETAERALREMDCCPGSLAGGVSVSFQLIYCERRRPL